MEFTARPGCNTLIEERGIAILSEESLKEVTQIAFTQYLGSSRWRMLFYNFSTALMIVSSIMFILTTFVVYTHNEIILGPILILVYLCMVLLLLSIKYRITSKRLWYSSSKVSQLKLSSLLPDLIMNTVKYSAHYRELSFHESKYSPYILAFVGNGFISYCVAVFDKEQNKLLFPEKKSD